MNTIIKIRKEELAQSLAQKIIALANSINTPEVIIRISENDTNTEFHKNLDESIYQIKNGQSRTFTMQELEEFIKS